MAWARQQKSFDILRNYLHSKERLSDTRNHDIPGMLEALYAARAFINQIKNCPVQSEFPTSQELTIITTWADHQKQWEIK